MRFRFDTRRDREIQVGRQIEREIHSAEQAYGSYTRMLHAEVLANQRGERFTRPHERNHDKYRNKYSYR